MKSKWSILSINFPQKYFDTYPQNNSIYVAQYTICLWEKKKKKLISSCLSSSSSRESAGCWGLPRQCWSCRRQWSCLLPPVAASLQLIINYKYDYTWPQLLKSFDLAVVLLSSYFFFLFSWFQREIMMQSYLY